MVTSFKLELSRYLLNSTSCQKVVTPYPSQLKNNEEKSFLDQILTSLFHTYRTWDKRMLGSLRNSRTWSDIENAKLPETILGTAILYKMLSINVLELLFTLLW